MELHKIEAVLKVTERCNINCTYCYMFNKESSLYQEKPKQISADTAESVARFLATSARETGASVVRVIFHGGEPMMLRVQEFDAICAMLNTHISPFARTEFSIQTNAMLVTDEWIELFSKYGINVGVSLDGDKATNDKFRIDHRGRGTYDRVMVGVKRLFDAAKQGRIAPPAVLCVIDPSHDGAKTFRHFASEIGFKWMDFLLPIDTLDALSPAVADKVGKYLIDVFDAWNELGDRSISIRFFDQFYSFMTGQDRMSGMTAAKTGATGKTDATGKTAPAKGGRNVIITIASDGTYGPDDTLRIVSDDLYAFDTKTDKLTSYLSHPSISAIDAANMTVPDECHDCSWARYCVGGARNGRIVNRYSKENGFVNRSGLCAGLDEIYKILARHLIGIGYPSDLMYRRLRFQKEVHA